jgi:outer membrane lipoprotein-sorting protein
MTLFRVFLSALLFCASLGSASAQSAEQKGQQIAQAAEAATSGYADFTVSGDMTLQTAGGGTSARRFEMKSVELNGGRESRSLLVFDWPGDIRGTALLTHAFDTKQDAQWLYLPSVGRVKKISGSGRSGSFVGSEFAYEDMVEQDVSNYSHVWIRDEACPNGGGQCHVIQRTPQYSSGYSQQIAWIDTAGKRYQTIQYYNRRGQLNKTLVMSGYRTYNGRFSRPSRMTMVNHQTGKRTVLDWKDYRFDTGLQPSAFTQQAMTR